MPDSVTLRDSAGRAYGVPQEQVASYISQGFRPETDEEGINRTASETFSDVHGGIGGAIEAGTGAVLSGATLGLSDQAFADRATRHAREEHPYVTGAGMLAGSLAPALLTGGASAGAEAGIGARILAASPAGLAGKLGGAISGLGEGAGFAGRLAAATAGAGAEGALYGGGQYLTETALEDKPLSAEGFVAGMGHGALFAAPIGGGLTLASKTLQRARALFPRSEISAASASGVQQQAASSIAQATRDGDQMVAAAERKLSDVEAQTQTALAGENTTRRVFGEAHPQAMVDQVTGAVDRQQITQALDGYQQARAQLDEWLASESDPELAKALTGMRAPEPGEIGGRIGPVVPTGEFGAPGAGGFKSQDELAQLAMGTDAPGVAPSLEPQATRQLRSGAKGTPVGEAPALSAPAGFEPPRVGPSHPDIPMVPPREPVRSGVPISELKSAGETDTNFVLRRMRHQGETVFPHNDRGERWIGSLGIDWKVPENHAVLMRMLRDGDALLSRNDLVDMFDEGIVGRSEIEDMGEQFHFIHDTGQPVTIPSGPVQDVGLPNKASNIGKYKVGARAAPEVPPQSPKSGPAVDETFKVKRNGDDLSMHMTSSERVKDDGRGVIEINVEHNPGDGGEGVPVGVAEFVHHGDGELYPLLVSVDDDFHRLGIATRMYDAAEATTGRKIINAEDQTPEGAAFRAARNSRRPPSADPDLLSQLQGTASKIGEGGKFSEIGAAPREAYAADKAARSAEAARYFRAQALEAREAAQPWNAGIPHGKGGTYETSPMAAAEREAQSGAVKQQMTGVVEPGAVPRFDPETKSYFEGAPGAPVHTGGPEDLAKMLGVDLQGMPVSAAGYSARREAMGLPGALERGARKTPEERAIAKAIMRHNGKNVDIGPNLARGAKIIGDMEEASARLTDVLGAEAPATAVENAAQYRAAIRAQAESSAASAAKAGADVRTRVGPAMDATAVDDDIAKALRQHEMRNPPAAAVPAPAVAAAAGASSGLGGGLADVGSALEVLHAIGAHVPAVSHIPVIGPILGLWLKARAVWGILGRKGGSIGRSTEGSIAAKAAATRERIVAATGAILEGAGKVAGAASHLAGPAVLLAGPLFAGGSKPDSDKPRDLFEARVNDIVRAQSPGAIDQAISQRFPTSDPALHDAIVAQLQRGIGFLDSKRPKQTVLPGVLPGDGTWKPSMAAIDEFAKFVHAVNDPVSVLEDLAKGHPSAEGAETLRVVYPELYAYAQKELLKAAPQMATTLPYSRRVMISILYKIPVDGTMQPSHAQYLQVPAPPAPGPAHSPSATGPLRLGQQTMSPLDARASGA